MVFDSTNLIYLVREATDRDMKQVNTCMIIGIVFGSVSAFDIGLSLFCFMVSIHK
jgi:hypothetical protein